MAITTNRTAPLYEGTIGLSLRCVVTPNNTGVNISTYLFSGVTGPADGDRVTTNDNVDSGVATVEYSIGVLSLTDTGTYICSATVSPNATISSPHILAATNTASLPIAIEGG